MQGCRNRETKRTMPAKRMAIVCAAALALAASLLAPALLSAAAFADTAGIPTGPDIPYRIVSVDNPNVVLTVQETSDGEPAGVVLDWRSDDARQLFILEEADDGETMVIALASDTARVLSAEVSEGRGALSVDTRDSGAFVRWTMVNLGNGQESICVAGGTSALSARSASAWAGEACVVRPDTRGVAQEWMLEAALPAPADPVYEGAPTIVCVGDSFLAGYALEGMQVNWGQVVGALLRSTVHRYDDGGSGFLARGGSGYDFARLADKAHAEYPDADIVIVAGGYNDSMAGMSPTAMRSAARSLGAKARALWPDAEIYVFANLWGNGENTYLGNAHTAAADARAEAVAAGIESLGDSRIHVCADCWDWLSGTGVSGLVGRDNVHPTSMGQVVIGVKMVTFMLEEAKAAVESENAAGDGPAAE